MTSRPVGLFDQEIRQRKLQALGDPLVELDRIVPWGMFRETLESMRAAGRDPRKGGRPPHDAVRMFKVLVLRGRAGRVSDRRPAVVPALSGPRPDPGRARLHGDLALS